MARFDLPLSEESRKKRFFSRWQFFVVLCVLVAIGGAVFYFGGGRQYYRSWQAKSQLEMARSLAESEEWKAASSHAQQSVKLVPSLEGVRLVAKSAYHIRSPELLSAAFKLFRYEGATLEDRTWALKLFFDLKDLKTAKVMSEELTDEEQKHAPIRFQLVRGLLLDGKFNAALALANQADAPKDPSLDLLLAVSFARTGILEARGETGSRLRKVVECDDRGLALAALAVISSLTNQWLEAPLAKAAIARFREDTDLNAMHSLHLISLRIRIGDVPVEVAVENAITEYRESDPDVLVRWLFKLGQFNRILEITTDDEIKKTKATFLVRLLVLIQTEDWESLQVELENPPVQIPEPLRLGLDAMGLKMQGKGPESVVKWQKAMKAAKSDEKENWFYELAKIATRLRNRDGHMECLISAIARRDRVPPRAESLAPVFAWLVEKGDQKAILSLSENLLLHEPDNPVLINNALYLKAIYREPTREDLKILENLVGRFPDQPSFVLTLAMLKLRLNELMEVIETLNSFSSDKPTARNTKEAIRANALFKLGKEVDARALAESISYKDFSKQEASLLKLPAPKKAEVLPEVNPGEEESD
ncbi:MAG: hypothetical protein P1U90_08075 [Akkermansiaceae bacterium]|nr:hypothetical protein [Akkermansiaceae bacterium]